VHYYVYNFIIEDTFSAIVLVDSPALQRPAVPTVAQHIISTRVDW